MNLLSIYLNLNYGTGTCLLWMHLVEYLPRKYRALCKRLVLLLLDVRVPWNWIHERWRMHESWVQSRNWIQLLLLWRNVLCTLVAGKSFNLAINWNPQRSNLRCICVKCTDRSSTIRRTAIRWPGSTLRRTSSWRQTILKKKIDSFPSFCNYVQDHRG